MVAGEGELPREQLLKFCFLKIKRNLLVLNECSCILVRVFSDGPAVCRSDRLHWRAAQARAYNLFMAKSSHEPFEVGCPCCNAVLKVDPETKAVLSHVAAVKPKTFNDFEAAAKAMREQEGRKESIFRQAVDAQKNNASLLEKKFQEAVKKAKETPDEGRPLRDFDLD
jgi:hypothetical protein